MIEVVEYDQFDMVWMNHGKVNAMDCEFLTALIEQIESFQNTPRKYLVLRSGVDSHVFSAGIDLKRMISEPPSYAREFFPLLIDLFERVYFCQKPIVAIVEGAAIAGGCIMAAAAQVRFGTSTARFGMPNKELDVPIPQLAFQILRETLPEEVASGLHAGRLLSVTEAQEYGLVTQMIESDISPTKLFDLIRAIPVEARPFNYVEQRAREKDGQMIDQWCTDVLRSRVGEYVNKILEK